MRPWKTTSSRWRWRSKAKDVALSLTQSHSSAQEPHATPLRCVDPRRQCALGLGQVAVRRRCRNMTTLSGSRRQSPHRAGDKGDLDVIDAHLKIGDVYKDGDVKQHQQALAEYQSGLADLRDRACQAPGRLRSSAQQGKGVLPHRRAAQGATTRSTTREPTIRRRSTFKTAWSRATHRRPSPRERRPTRHLKSNLAATYTHWGHARKEAGNLELALEKLRQGVALDEELTKNEPGNPQWQDFSRRTTSISPRR